MSGVVGMWYVRGSRYVICQGQYVCDMSGVVGM